MALPKPNRSQLTAGVTIATALAIVGGLTWGFGQQLALARQMRAEEIRLEQAVAAEQARNDELTAQLEYVESDEYVEYWARKDAKMSRRGEVAVVPLASTGEEPASITQPVQTPEPETQPFWVELWELLFGPAGP
ncbi:MAG: septum formation initiator family protein [Chloroflexota bacterium]|nr:septum formation initiator family protein [Chloroflexota bacterium]